MNHSDGSAGGLLRAIRMIKDAKQAKGQSDKLVVDVHPDRPEYRGLVIPILPNNVISLEADPTFDEIQATGAVIEKHSDSHTVLNDFFFISGEIPRVTPYETGLKGGVRFDPEDKEWFSEEIIADERLLMCNLKGGWVSTSISRRC